jgi:predicted permease
VSVESFPAESLLPIFVYFLVGLALRRSGVASAEHADFLYRLIFLVTLPALVFMSVSRAELGPDTALLPVCGFVTNLVCAGIAALAARLRGLTADQSGAVVLCAGIMNMGYMFPFILATLGEDALADAILFDAGNAIFVATLTYPVAQYYGEQKARFSVTSLRRVLLSPIFLSIVAALAVNLLGFEPGSFLTRTLAPLGSATIPLMLIAVGMSFGGFASNLADATFAVILRMFVGVSLGCLFVWLFGFSGTTAIIIVVSTAAPVGASAAAIAAVSRLNKDIAVNAISMSALIGLVTAPILLFITIRIFA